MKRAESYTLEQLFARCRECGECWEWISDAKSEARKRHPQIKVAGKVELVRRVIYAAARGFVRSELRLVPFCDNPYCVNPAHQKAITESQKGRRAALRGSFSNPARGAKIAAARRLVHSKITMEQAQEIRGSEDSSRVLAARYGLNISRVKAIRAGRAWKNYSSPFAGLMPSARG